MSQVALHTDDQTLAPIGALWVGERLRWLDRLSLASFVHQGHAVALFHLDGFAEPPIEGVEFIHAREVFDYDRIFLASVKPSVFSDMFALHLISKSDFICVDTDVLALRPFRPKDGYLVGREHGGWVNVAVMRLPEDSAALHDMMDCVTDPTTVPEWLPEDVQAKVMRVQPKNRLMEACKRIRNTLGPRMLTHMLKKHNEKHHALPVAALNPLPWSMADAYFNPHGGVEGWLTDETQAVHLYSSRIRALHLRVAPYPNSFMAKFAADIGFSFGDLPQQTEGF
ncbi:hypothetical protein DI396_10785 [Litorivita pollutaquae]|uniref:Uncharacterized protein n=1 Tax=Litorivita pollutaquae TaxID=2200892 RepID=A0A2V4NM54_9RHOB|nr:hypothetical protein [Litorivita pollutaquae]PYC47437.1 hypothetical protein DI396_10785 [Litorivita pollutaquae]